MKRTLKFFIVVFVLMMTLFFVRGAYAENERNPRLKLMATVIDKDFNQSSCVIMNLDTGKQSPYKVMDQVSGYQIVKIIRGSVKLLKEGKVYVLDFPLGNENIPESYESISIKRQAVLEKISNPGVLLTEAKPMPYVKEGKIQGFKIPALKDKSLLKMAGLAEGDIATKINGEKLDSIPKALQLCFSVSSRRAVFR